MFVCLRCLLTDCVCESSANDVHIVQEAPGLISFIGRAVSTGTMALPEQRYADDPNPRGNLRLPGIMARLLASRPTRPPESVQKTATGPKPRTTPRPYILPESVEEQITDHIVANATTMTDMFEAWDKNKDRLICKVEWRAMLRELGC